MGASFKGSISLALLAMPLSAASATCTTQAELQPQDRSALAAIAQRLAVAVVQQDFSTLQAQLLPAVSSEWDGIHNEAEVGAPLLKGGQPELQSIYLLDASNQTAPSDTQFFCSNQSGSLTVTINICTPYRLVQYAVVLANATGAQLGRADRHCPGVGPHRRHKPDGSSSGLSVLRQGIIDGHDGVWYWSHARAEAGTQAPWRLPGIAMTWRAIFLLPVDFISSPNMQKLDGRPRARGR